MDLTNPESPVICSRAEIPSFVSDVDIETKGNLIFIAIAEFGGWEEGNSGVHVYYIKDINNPKFIVNFGEYAFSIEFYKNYAIMAKYNAGLVVLDLKEFQNQKVVSMIEEPCENPVNRAEKISIYKDIYAYVANYNSIWIINSLKPSSYFVIDTADISVKVEAKDNYLFVNQYSSGIGIIDFSDSKNPKEVARYMKKSKYCEEIQSIYLDGNFLYFGTLLYFGILNVTDPKGPVEISSLRNKIEDPFELWSVDEIKVRGGYAYTVGFLNGLKIYNVKDPRNPYLLSSAKSCSMGDHIDLYGNIAYVSCWTEGLGIVDISNPENPVFLKNIKEFGPVNDVEMYKNKLYIFGAYNLYICDISDPLNPKVFSFIPSLGKEKETAKGNLMFIACFSEYLKIINITNENNPYVKEYLKTSVAVCDVKIFNDLLIVLNFEVGIEIYDTMECFCKHKRPF